MERRTGHGGVRALGMGEPQRSRCNQPTEPKIAIFAAVPGGKERRRKRGHFSGPLGCTETHRQGSAQFLEI